MPLTIIFAALLDIGFVFLYIKKAHPWKGILTDEEEEKEKKLMEKKVKKEKKLMKKQFRPNNAMKRHFPHEFM